MKEIPSKDPNRKVFRDDWGWFWRLVGWVIAAFGVLYLMGLYLPDPSQKSATTQPAASTQPANPKEDPGLTLAFFIFGLAGWCFYRRWIILDKRDRAITVRCGVWLLGWTWRRPFSDFEHVIIDRRESRRKRTVWYTVYATGKGGKFTLATIDKDRLFDSSMDATLFAGAVAGFCGFNRKPPTTVTHREVREI